MAAVAVQIPNTNPEAQHPFNYEKDAPTVGRFWLSRVMALAGQTLAEASRRVLPMAETCHVPSRQFAGIFGVNPQVTSKAPPQASPCFKITFPDIAALTTSWFHLGVVTKATNYLEKPK